MPLSYTNRNKEVFYFKVSKTKKDNSRYYVTKKIMEDCINTLPEGFEIYEHPEEAKVVIRKIITPLIFQNELEVVNKAVLKNKDVKDFMIGIEANILTIYIANQSKIDIERKFNNIIDSENKLQELLNAMQRFIPKMRFELINKLERAFCVQRFCYHGSNYGWINLENSNDLNNLANKYCYHLEKDSYFEFEDNF
ncbi:MAG: hypothetical protein U0457_11550 [Candidatus Sericytochromatia bacterium]